MYQVALTAWMHGELGHPDIEPWTDFRARTRAFVASLAERDEARPVVAITSGGAIAAMVTEALGLDGAHALELMWSLKNASVSRLRFGTGRFGQGLPRRAHLEVFNETAHLGGDEHLHTHV
jgi:broad specificity phosphatase PhoE